LGHTIHKLTATRIARTTRPGYYGDGGGLYLQITSAGVKSWVFRYMLVGRARFMGLGPLHTISLAEVRVHALDCRKQLLLGIDPLNAKHNEQTERRLAAVKSKTFDECSKAYIEAQQA
jgi:Arm DNA-binding domain